MKRDSPSEKDSRTDSSLISRCILTGNSGGDERDDEQVDGEETDPSDRAEIGRRSYMLAAGAAVTTTLAGCSGRFLNENPQVKPVSAFGYGGEPVLAQASSVQLAISESEPNDTQAAATVVEFGATISGTLGQADVDWYTFDVPSDTTIRVDFNRAASSGVTAVILYDTTGDFANLRYVGTDQQVSFTESTGQSGPHFLEIVDTQASDGDYSVTVGPNTDSPTPTQTATPTPTETATPSATATPTPTPSTDDDYGEQGYGEYSYGGLTS